MALVLRPRWRWRFRCYGWLGRNGRRRWWHREFAILCFCLPCSLFIQHVSLCFAILLFDHDHVVLPTNGSDRRITVQEVLVVFGVCCFFLVFSGWSRRRRWWWRNIIRHFNGRGRWRRRRRGLFFTLRMGGNSQGQHGTCHQKCFLHKLVLQVETQEKTTSIQNSSFIFPGMPAAKRAGRRQSLRRASPPVKDKPILFVQFL